MEVQTQTSLLDTVGGSTDIIEACRRKGALERLEACEKVEQLQEFRDYINVLDLSASLMTSLEGYELLDKACIVLLGRNLFDSLSKIQIFPNLVFLDLSGNQLRSLGFSDFWRDQPQLRFLYLDGNQLTDLTELRFLQHLKLVHLTLAGNYFGDNHAERSQSWLKAAALDQDVQIDFQDEQESKAAYEKSLYFNERKKTLKLPLHLKLSASFTYCLSQIVLFSQRINEAAAHLNPAVIIQRYFRGYKMRRFIKTYRKDKLKASQKIQQIGRVYLCRQHCIKLVYQTKQRRRDAAKLLLRVLRQRRDYRKSSIDVIQNLRVRIAADVIRSALRRRQLGKAAIVEEAPVTLFIAKTHQTDAECVKSIIQMITYIMDDVMTAIMSRSETGKRASSSDIKTVPTNVQYLSPMLCVQRSIKSLKDAQRTTLDQRNLTSKQRKQNALFQKRLQNHFNDVGCERAQLRAMLHQIPPEIVKLTVESVKQQGAFYNRFEIYNTEFGGLMFFLLVTHCNQRSETEIQKKMFSFGQIVFQTLLTTGQRTYLNSMFIQGELPSFVDKSDQRQRISILSTEQILHRSASIMIQKFWRMHCACRRICSEKSTPFKVFTQVQEIILWQRAARVIQRRIRGVNGRCRQLVYQKMKESYCGVCAAGSLLISKHVLKQLRARSLKPCLSLQQEHMNLSPPINPGWTHRLFCEDSDSILVSKFKSLGFQMTTYWPQLAIPIKAHTEFYNSLTSFMMANETMQYCGYVQINSSGHPQSPLYSPLLKNWQQNESSFEGMGAPLICKPELVKSTVYNLDALKVLSGLRHAGLEENSDTDKLLSNYRLFVQLKPMDYKDLCQQILANVIVEEPDPSAFFAPVRPMLNQFVVLRPDRARREDMAVKALLMDLCFYHPFEEELPDSFTARKYCQLTSSQFTMTPRMLQHLGAVLIMQKQIRGLWAYREYHKNPVKSSLLKKITRIQLRVEGEKEQAAVQLINLASPVPEAVPPPKQQLINKYLTVSPTRLLSKEEGEPSGRDASDVKLIEKCVTLTAAKLAKYKTLQLNQLKHQAVSALLRRKISPEHRPSVAIAPLQLEIHRTAHTNANQSPIGFLSASANQSPRIAQLKNASNLKRSYQMASTAEEEPDIYIGGIGSPLSNAILSPDQLKHSIVEQRQMIAEQNKAAAEALRHRKEVEMQAKTAHASKILDEQRDKVAQQRLLVEQNRIESSARSNTVAMLAKIKQRERQ